MATPKDSGEDRDDSGDVNEDKKKISPVLQWGVILGIGIALGTVFGAAMDNPGGGMAIGIALGLGIGGGIGGIGRGDRSKRDKEK